MTCGYCGEVRDPDCPCDHVLMVMCARCGITYRSSDHEGPHHGSVCIPCLDAICAANEREATP